MGLKYMIWFASSIFALLEDFLRYIWRFKKNRNKMYHAKMLILSIRHIFQIVPKTNPVYMVSVRFFQNFTIKSELVNLFLMLCYFMLCPWTYFFLFHIVWCDSKKQQFFCSYCDWHPDEFTFHEAEHC